MRYRFAAPVLLFSLAAIPAQGSLIITPTFDSTITSDSNSAGIEGTINTAISAIESTYTTPINVLIYFQEGGSLGASNFFYGDYSYQTFYNHLAATDANALAIAGLTANGGNGAANPVTGTTDIELKTANARALGLSGAPNCYPLTAPSDGQGLPKECATTNGGNRSITPVDGIVSVETNITFPGSPGTSGQYDLLSTVEHEIDEILGLGSGLPNTSSATGTVTSPCPITGDNCPTPEDLFRYTQGPSGSRIFSVDCANATSAYFSYNGTTDLAQFNNACNGADFGDWASVNGVAAQVQDAFATSGAQPLYGPNEIAALSAIGYTVVPEPGTWISLSLSLAALELTRRLRIAGTRI